MNPDKEAVNRLLGLASQWAEAGHTGLQRTIGLLNIGRIGVTEAVARAGRDLNKLVEAGVDLRGKGLKAEEAIRRVNNIARIRKEKDDAEELATKLTNAQPLIGPKGRRMAMMGLGGAGIAALLAGTHAIATNADKQWEE
mgnify:CR=1 FL=1|jgi:hypothetical protein|tara:strand:+ start:59 stop:478 length:420 start_codon:yes stop_codon:yes gene_type:complete